MTSLTGGNFNNKKPLRIEGKLIENLLPLGLEGAQRWKYVISTDNFYRSYICSVLLKITQETRHSTAAWNTDLYDCAKITFIHPLINAQWHAKVG